ncbi:hypothetical protein RHO14_07920 [Orbus wheelerorum]|uniref:hypothetical protein n=1 Tax=Orbus wheelerorum TaxID=3074111 RepID=UPI00370D5CD3
MSATFSFGNDLIVVVNNAGMGILDRVLRPCFNNYSALSEKIYFHYDLYDGPIDFSELTSEQYMKAYGIMKDIFENDLQNNLSIGDSSCQWAIDLWFNEIKPKMQCSPLYRS